jgi:hypothetical protein
MEISIFSLAFWGTSSSLPVSSPVSSTISFSCDTSSYFSIGTVILASVQAVTMKRLPSMMNSFFMVLASFLEGNIL